MTPPEYRATECESRLGINPSAHTVRTPHAKHNRTSAFTLIELSIVLVIIGLIVGGVLVGQNLINAAAVRTQITQIEKYNTAVNTFRTKYNNDLPGDMNATDAAQFGFAARGQYAGQGDGNGIIEGVSSDAPSSNKGMYEFEGETLMFWVDLSTAELIDTTLNSAKSNAPFPPGSDVTPTSSPGLSNMFPAAKLGGGNYIYVYSNNSTNYFGVSAPTLVGTLQVWSNPGLSVQQAFAIDNKIDDGYPQTGNVTAQYLNFIVSASVYAWADGTGADGPADASATAGSATTCYDNGGSAGTTQHYSLEQNGGAGVNCALSFQFQ